MGEDRDNNTSTNASGNASNMNSSDNYHNQQAMYGGENPKGMGKKILKPIVQEKIVKVPVTQYVEKIVEREEVKYVNKYVDVIKPIITYKTKHVSKPIYLDKIKYETKIVEKEKIIHIPKIEYKNKIVEVPVYVHREKIIEKKVPLIVERIIPVLRVKTHEQNVLTNTIAMSDICNMTDEHNRTFRMTNEHLSEDSSRRVHANQGNYVSNVKSTAEVETTDRTYRLNQESAYEAATTTSAAGYSNVHEKKYQQDMSSATSIVNADGESNATERMHVKHDTIYNESGTEDVNVEERGEEEQEKIRINIHTTENESPGDFTQTSTEENQQYYNMTGGSECMGSRARTNMSEHMRESNIYERNISGSQSNYNMSTNNLMSINNVNAFNESGQLHPMYTTNKSISEQIINRSVAQIDPKLYSSFPVQGSFPERYSDIAHDKIEIEQNYTRTSVTPISREQYNSLQSAQVQRNSLTPSKQNFRPAYANSNGQSVLSIKPAIIVEQKQKNKKPRAPMCNFLNQCCGGNQE